MLRHDVIDSRLDLYMSGYTAHAIHGQKEKCAGSYSQAGTLACGSRGGGGSTGKNTHSDHCRNGNFLIFLFQHEQAAKLDLCIYLVCDRSKLQLAT